MRIKFYALALTGLLTLGVAGGAAMAQDTPVAPPQQGGGGHRGMDPDAQLKHMTKALDRSTACSPFVRSLLVLQKW